MHKTGEDRAHVITGPEEESLPAAL